MKWQKPISYLVIWLVILFPLTVVFADDDDTTRGTMYFDNLNDPPIFMDWYVTEQLVSPGTDVTFFVEIYDNDNTSGELIVTFYFSLDNFDLDNSSDNMIYISEVEPDTYCYELLIFGKPSGTYMNYYYQVNDGFNTEKEPLPPNTFSIQWSYPEVRIPSPEDYEPEPKVIPTSTSFIAVFLFLLLPAFVFVLAVFNNNSKKKAPSRR